MLCYLWDQIVSTIFLCRLTHKRTKPILGDGYEIGGKK